MEAKEEGVGDWSRFRLWPAQRDIAEQMQANPLLVILKARQLGLSWLCVAFALWLMLFRPIATVLLFSLRDTEATKLLKRLKGMHARLPEWMRQPVTTENEHEVEFGNGSTAAAMTKAGDSYTASLVLVDEMDLRPDQADLLASVKPTIADGGRLLLVSKANKSKPESPFKRIYREAKSGKGGWRRVFLPWHARPGRTPDWYEEERQASLAVTGSLDDFHGNYPATDAEALSPRSLDKRFAPSWFTPDVWQELAPLEHRGPAIPGFTVYVLPKPGKRYVIGADPAEGNPTSDDSAACVLDADTGEQCAVLVGKHEPSAFGGYIIQAARWYNVASVMAERNNHGHTLIKHLRENGKGVRVLLGLDKKEGWLSSQKGKTELYDSASDQVRNGEVVIHDFVTLTQLQSIDGSTLRAPEGQRDDRADAFALAAVARLRSRPLGMPATPPAVRR